MNLKHRTFITRNPHCISATAAARPKDKLRLHRTFAQLVVVELLERFPPEATGIAGSAHMQAAAAYLSNSEELAGCRRTVGRAMPAFDPDAATSPAGIFCTVRCRHPLPEVVEPFPAHASAGLTGAAAGRLPGARNPPRHDTEQPKNRQAHVTLR